MDFQRLEAGLKSVPEQLKWLETMVLEHQVSRRPGIELIPPPPHPPRVFHSHNLALPFGPRAFAQLFPLPALWLLVNLFLRAQLKLHFHIRVFLNLPVTCSQHQIPLHLSAPLNCNFASVCVVCVSSPDCKLLDGKDIVFFG